MNSRMKDFTSHWQFYVIPDLKTWSTHAAFQTPLEHFANPADAFARFKELRAAPYNHEPQDFHSNGEPYARLTLGMEQKERQRSLHLLQVRDGQNTLITDFSTLAYIQADGWTLFAAIRRSRRWMKVWTAVQAINQERALFAADSAPPKPFLFTGKLVCADCNAPLKGNREIHLTKNGISKSYVSYCCSCYTSSGSSACTRHTIYEKTLTELVLKEICAHAEKLELNETAVLEMLQRRRSLASDNHVENIRKEITKLRRRVHELEQATAKLYEDKSMGALNSDVFFMMLQKREKERQQKMKRMNNLQAEMDLCAQDNFHIQKWMTLIRKYLHLRELDRAIVDELIDHIEIGERTLVNGQSRRSVKVYYRFVGLVDEAPSLQVNENKLSL